MTDKDTTGRTTQRLFDLVVDPKVAHPSFEIVRTQSLNAPTRWMLERVFERFSDPDGNFVEQFQTAGFDARFFELYLFAYFFYSGFDVDRTHAAPDFIVGKDDLKIAVEATTVNPSTAGVLKELGKQIGDLSPAEMTEYQRHELAIRFGGPLFSKLKRRYWDLPHVRGLPLVLAIEAFHEDDSLGMGDSTLSSYVYGIEHAASWDESGKLRIEFDRIYSHVLGTKEIPSSFFDQPDTENISAIVFTNAGTTAKFGRMAFQYGIGNETIDMWRTGYCLNLDPDVRDPTHFSYNVGDPPVVEWWGQGLVVLHNPRCLYPIGFDAFPGATHTVFEQGRPTDYVQSWHVFSSKTFMIDMGENKQRLAELIPLSFPRYAVGGITKTEFHDMVAFEPPESVVEEGWFSDESNAFLGVVLHDTKSGTWGCSLFGRDEFFEFFEIESSSAIPTRFDAVRQVQRRIAKGVSKPQRIFPRSDQLRAKPESTAQEPPDQRSASAL